jgi:hypothetical protein
MRKGKKRALDENEDEYKTANARFKNPFHTTLDYTLTSASAESSQLNTVQDTHTIAYDPPTRPVLVSPPQLLDTPDLPDSASPDSKKKTQVSATASYPCSPSHIISCSLPFFWINLVHISTRSRILFSLLSTIIQLAALALVVWMAELGLAVVSIASNPLSLASNVLSRGTKHNLSIGSSNGTAISLYGVISQPLDIPSLLAIAENYATTSRKRHPLSSF